jgi:hypothetical protein
MPLTDALLAGLGFLCMTYCLWLTLRLKRLYKTTQRLDTLLAQSEKALEANRAQLEAYEDQRYRVEQSLKGPLKEGESVKNDLAYFVERGEALLHSLDPLVCALVEAKKRTELMGEAPEGRGESRQVARGGEVADLRHTDESLGSKKERLVETPSFLRLTKRARG